MGTLTSVTYKIKKLSPTDELDGHPQFVRGAMWVATGTDGENTVTQDGASAFNLEPQESFVPFEALTEETVIGWLLTQRELDEHVRSVLQTKLDEKTGAATVAPDSSLPWGNP